MEWKRILCPIDFSPTSRGAADAAVGLARRFGATVTLFHSYDMPAYPMPDGSFVPVPMPLQEITDAIERTLAEWKRTSQAAAPVPIDVASTVGPATSEILRFAKEGRYDLIVMGTHGRTGLRHMLLGSVAERIVREAACPVLTIRTAAVPVKVPAFAETPVAAHA